MFQQQVTPVVEEAVSAVSQTSPIIANAGPSNHMEEIVLKITTAILTASGKFDKRIEPLLSYIDSLPTQKAVAAQTLILLGLSVSSRRLHPWSVNRS